MVPARIILIIIIIPFSSKTSNRYNSISHVYENKNDNDNTCIGNNDDKNHVYYYYYYYHATSESVNQISVYAGKRHIFTVVSWLPVPLVKPMTGSVATTVNKTPIYLQSEFQKRPVIII